MSSTVAGHAPELFEGEQPTEILVPIGTGYPGRRDLIIAAAYGDRWGIPIRLAHVATESEASDRTGIQAALAATRSAFPKLEVVGVEVSAETVSQGVANVRGDRSLLFLASDRSSQWLDRGSVGEDLLQASDYMVMLCGPHCQDPPLGTSVVVPLDGSARAESALTPGIAFARSTGAKLWLVTVVTPVVVEAVAELRGRGEAVSESGYLRTVAETLAADGFDVGWEVVHDHDPVAGVIEFVDTQGSAVVVAATHGDTGIAKRVFGSVCLGLVEDGPVPVLIVKTDQSDPEPLLAKS